MMLHHPTSATLGQLKSTGYRYRSVKQELRENLIARMQAQRELFPGILGYRQTVIPQIAHAILSRHDMLFLGLRGQAKTRILRMLPELLDPWIPVLAEMEIPDDPLHPMTSMGQRLVREKGDDTPIRWLHRKDRYHEKLATPDVTIADLLGEVDIVKHAQGRYLSDESTMHFGLIPRTNRGLFAINELPDLSPRIQVGLFNVLEERDVQIRGYPIRLNLDVALVFSANPEDYTNRGRIVTPLKDRIGSVIRTHYPANTEEAMAITLANAWLERSSAASVRGSSAAARAGEMAVNASAPEQDATWVNLNTQSSPQVPVVDIPAFMLRIIEEAVSLARKSPHINQASGVSVRTSMACAENMVSSCERRGILTGEARVVPRICDLQHIVASCRGKIELMLAEDGSAAEDKLVTSLLGESVKLIFKSLGKCEEYDSIAEQFESGLTLTIGDEVAADEQLANMKHVTGLLPAAGKLAKKMKLDSEDTQTLASVAEFLLEALYVNNRLSKHTAATGSRYGR